MPSRTSGFEGVPALFLWPTLTISVLLDMLGISVRALVNTATNLLLSKRWTTVCRCNLLHVLIFNDSLTSGKAFHMARKGDIAGSVERLRYYAGWQPRFLATSSKWVLSL